jgi:hypothetical protein
MYLFFISSIEAEIKVKDCADINQNEIHPRIFNLDASFYIYYEAEM